MNNLYARNNNIHQSDGVWPVKTIRGLPAMRDDDGVWLPKPCIHALSPPMHLGNNERLPLHHSYKTDTRTFKESDRATPDSSHHSIGIPKTIAIPAVPVTPEMQRTSTGFERSHDNDDFSSVGMGTLGYESRFKRHRELQDDDDDMSMETIAECTHTKYKRLKHQESIDNESCCSVAAPPQELQWKGLTENASLEQPPTFTQNADDTSIGTFTIDDNVSKLEAHCDDLNSKATLHASDASSTEGEDDMTIVLEAGTSTPKLPTEIDNDAYTVSHWDGRFTFADCFDKNASLVDFLNAEAAHNCTC